jgi:hypothetical protein
VSDDKVHIVDLTTTGANAVRMAASVKRWLIAEQVIVAEAGEWGPHPYGPRWETAIEEGQVYEPQGYNGIEIRVGRNLYDATEAFVPLACPSCGHRAPMGGPEEVDAVLERIAELTKAWAATGEPEVSCPGCGQTRPVGDWNSVSFAYGEIGVSVVNWPPLDGRMPRMDRRGTRRLRAQDRVIRAAAC